MLKLPKISVTGDLASGKSQACQFFSDLGAYTINADHIAQKLLVPDTVLGKRVVALLGEDVVVDGLFDRRKISDRVFGVQGEFRLLKCLEAILHPEIQRNIEDYYSEAVVMGKFPLFVAEVPLLYESGMESWYDVVIFVCADSEIRQERYIKKTKRSDFVKRCERFLPMEERAARSDVIIENNGSLEHLKDQVSKYFYSLKEKL